MTAHTRHQARTKVTVRITVHYTKLQNELFETSDQQQLTTYLERNASANPCLSMSLLAPHGYGHHGGFDTYQEPNANGGEEVLEGVDRNLLIQEETRPELRGTLDSGSDEAHLLNQEIARILDQKAAASRSYRRATQRSLPLLAISLEGVEVYLGAITVELRKSPEFKRAFKKSFEEAQQLVQGLRVYHDGLTKIGECVRNKQQDFFRAETLNAALAALVPLEQKELVQEIGLTESTISRLIAGKEVITPVGIVPLNWFFTGRSKSNPHQTSYALKSRIRDLIAQESPDAPLTDFQLAALLAQEGRPIGRKQVNKYRQELQIPSSDKRRRIDSPPTLGADD